MAHGATEKVIISYHVDTILYDKLNGYTCVYVLMYGNVESCNNLWTVCVC